MCDERVEDSTLTASVCRGVQAWPESSGGSSSYDRSVCAALHLSGVTAVRV